MRRIFYLLSGLLLFGLNAAAQTRTISGKISDMSGVAVPDASVMVTGSAQGTVTDDQGNFTITVPASAKSLTVSSVNYATQVISLGASNVLNIILQPAEDELQEVVVTGYTVTTRSKSPVASSVVTSKDIENIPITNVNDILQGKASGLTVMSTSGQPGASSNVRIRGVGSISAGASPVYVIDGIIVERGQFFDGYGGSTQNNDILSNLNPNDIESVTVLKDAAALALYGSRGGNGVIVITTKKGKAGASRINVTAQYGKTRPSFGNWEMMNAREVYDYERDLLALNGYSQNFIDEYLNPGLLDKTFNWVDAAFVEGSVQSYDLSLSGGNEKTRQYFSLGYYDQQGTVLNSGFKRFNANLSLDHQVSGRLKVGATFNTSYSNTLIGDGGSYFSSPILNAFANSPLWMYPYKEDGSLFVGNEDEFSKNSGNNLAGDKFLYSSSLNYNRLYQFRGLGKIFGEFALTNWLTLKQNVAIDMIFAREKSFFDPTTGNGINMTDPSKSGIIYEGLNNPVTYTSQSSLSGNISLGEGLHDFQYLALMEYQRFNHSSFYAEGLGVANGALQVLNVTGTPNTTSGNITEYSFLSYLGQLNYTFNNKYSVTGSVRRDGSSRFGKENRFATFYSVGGSWRLSEEAFMQNQSVFSDVRLRASYGTSGVADFDNYVARQLYEFTTAYDGTPGSAPSTPGNPGLTWEKNAQADIGLELGFLNDRIRATFDLYRRVSSDLLQNVPVSRTSGFTTIQSNVGKLENKGFELTINSANVRTRNFQWSTDLNLSYNHNEVLKLYNGQDIPGGTLARTREGYAIGDWFLPVWAGVDPDNGDPLWLLADKTTTNSYAVASRTANRQFVGSSMPRYLIGLNNSLNYKGIGLSFFFYAMTGSKVYNQTMSLIDSDGLRYGWNYYKHAGDNYWTTPGQQADRPKPMLGGNKNSVSASTRWLERNDYIRLRNITLSYTLSAGVTERLKLNRARLFLTGTNLLTFTNYKGVDPENALGGNDIFKYPVNKAITAGLEITL